MASKLRKSIWKKILIVTLVFSIVTGTFYQPVTAPKAQAFLGIADFGFDIDVKAWVGSILDSIAMSIAQKMIDDIVKSTVNWANTGFEGGPAYTTDTGQFFEGVADSVTGQFIDSKELGFLCSPFRNTIRLSLAANYYQPIEERYQCTLDDVLANAQSFYQDFNVGGWDAWFSMTQNSTNNPYGAYLEAQADLDSRLASAITKENQQLDWNSGFKSSSDCLAYNPSEDEILSWDNFTPPDGVKWDSTKAPGACIEYGPVKTPGSIIKSGLDNVLPSGLNRLISAQHIDQLVGAFASGLLNRFVFGDKGLFAKGTGSIEKEIVDKDGDGIPDGYDTNADGELDICHHGVIDSSKGPSNANCLMSSKAESSPFFIPICESVGSTLKELEKFQDFMSRNRFQEDYSNTWMRRLMVASESVDNLAGDLSRYEIQRFDPAIAEMSKYTKFMDTRIQSLAKDGDLKGGNASKEQGRLQDTTNAMVSYLKRFQTEVNKKCSNPDTAALGSIPVPDITTIAGPDDTATTNTGDSSNNSNQNSSSNNVTISCSADRPFAILNSTQVIWSASDNSPSTLIYNWNLDPDTFYVSYNNKSVIVTYSAFGNKTASVTATDQSGNSFGPISCTNSVVVAEGE